MFYLDIEKHGRILSGLKSDHFAVNGFPFVERSHSRGLNGVTSLSQDLVTLAILVPAVDQNHVLRLLARGSLLGGL
jgi:hypothetical protein